jgi:DNA-binding NtrC family response regulator
VHRAWLVATGQLAWQGIAMSQLIMVIDDEAGVRDLLGDALKLAGFETITAADAMLSLIHI